MHTFRLGHCSRKKAARLHQAVVSSFSAESRSELEMFAGSLNSRRNWHRLQTTRRRRAASLT